MTIGESYERIVKNADPGTCTIISIIITAFVIACAYNTPTYDNAFSELTTAQHWNETPRLLNLMCVETSHHCVWKCMNACDYYGYTLESPHTDRAYVKSTWERNSSEEENVAYRHSDEHKRSIKECVKCNIRHDELGKVIEPDVIGDKYIMRVILLYTLFFKGVQVCLAGHSYCLKSQSNRPEVVRDCFYFSLIDLAVTMSLFIIIPQLMETLSVVGAAVVAFIRVVLRPPEIIASY